jgi:3-oxoadipate enol-lactonase
MKAFVNGITLHYVDQGKENGLPLLFLHGFPFSHQMWMGQLAAMDSFYRCIAYDLRGHGMSDVGDGQFSIETHVDDLIALLDMLKIERTVIVGLSMGGYVTLRALERNPERFLAACLCDTRSEADSNEGKLRRFAGAKMVKIEGSKVFGEGFVKAVFAPESLTLLPAEVTMVQQIIERIPPLGIAGTLLALASRLDMTESLAKIAVPTLILVGEKDALTPPEASRAMHAKIRGSELHLISRAAHMSNLENPAEFNDRLGTFLKRVAAVGRQ